MIELPEGVKIEESTIEKRYRSVTAALSNRIRRLYEDIYDRFGDEGIELIREVSAEFGREIVERARGRIQGPDAKSIALYLVRIFNNVRGEGKVVEWTDERVVVRVYRCPYPFKSTRICEAHTTMEKVVVETLGDGLVYCIEKSIPRGDAYCDHVIEKRAE